MPYIVNDGQQVDDGTKSYGPGSFLPGSKGDLADMEEVGVVSWRDAGAKPAKVEKADEAAKVPKPRRVRKPRVRRKAAVKAEAPKPEVKVAEGHLNQLLPNVSVGTAKNKPSKS
jgi:hypothetical protein